jgi:hypothetical protein
VRPTDPDLYRGELLARYPAGDKHALLMVRRGAAPFALPERVAGALEVTLRRFRPLEVHSRVLGELLGDPQDTRLARQCLVRWAESGVLLRSGDLFEAAAAASRGDPAGGVPIRTVGVLTCDRVDALGACVESFAENAQRHGDACRVVVVDDSTAPSTRSGNVAALARVAARYGVEIAYAGADEKRAYADALARRSGVSPEVVAFALFGLAECGCSIGANRNALLLACAGEAFVSTDDDTIARLGRWPDASPGVDFATEGDPMEYRFFATREEALAWVPTDDESVLRLHSSALGRTLASIVTDAREHGVDLEGATPPTLEGLASGAGRVAATLAGLYGDSGMFGGAGFVMHWVRDGQAREGEEQYRLAVTSREILRVAPRLRIRRTAPFMSTSLGLDHRTLLPPFFPVLRDEDGVFGETLFCCFEDAHVAHVPRAVLHAAQPGRRYDPNHIGAARVRRMSDLLVNYTRGLAAGMAVREPALRMAVLGRALQDLGRATPGDLLAFTRALYLFNGAARARHLDAMLQSAPGAPPAWREDARAYLEAQRSALATEDHYYAADLREDRSPGETLALEQRLLRLYGTLLMSWPEIVGTARALREEGANLARRVDPTEARGA